MKFPIPNLAANEGPELVANSEGGAVFTVQAGGSFFIPFGEYEHQKGRQFFDRGAAEKMVANHNGLLAKMKRLVGGGSYPVYIGHPDLPGSPDQDKKAYAWIESMQVENDGLRLTPRWTTAGEELIQGGHFRFYSPLWYFDRRPGGGITPVQLKSVGLTNNPNIPVPALANEGGQDTTENDNEIMNPELLKALDLPEDADEAAVMDAITQLKEAAKPAAEETTDNEEETEETTETDAESTEETEETEENSEEETEAENELQAERDTLRGRLIDDAIAAALADNRIVAANEAAERDALANSADLPAAIDALKQRQPQLKTTAKAGDLGKARADAMAANVEGADAEERAQLVANEFARTNPALADNERRRIAWQRASAKNPELFGVKSPQATA